MKLPEVAELELDNGFRALLLPRRGLPVVASTLWYQVGSRDEQSGETGVSHFLEHMMFKGTARYGKGEIDLLTSRLGGSNNAFTSHDVTAYYFALAADRWPTALEIEASRMTGCLLDPHELAAEKSVVLEELAMGEDDPWHVLYQTLEALAFQVHPYHHPIIGWRQDLERLTPAAVRGYYERHYGPSRALLVAAGDLDVADTKARIRELFGGLRAREQARAVPLDEPAQRGERRAVQRFPAQSDIVRLAVAFPTCRMGEPDDFALDVLAYVLGGSKTSRLYRRLVLDDGTATNVSVNNEARLDPGLLLIGAELRPGVAPEPVERAIREEVERVAERGATRSELARARTQLRAAFLLEEETVLDVAMRIGRFAASTARGWRLLGEVLERYAAVGGRDVAAAATRYCAKDRQTVVWLLPQAGAARPAKRKARRPGRRR